MNTPKFVNDLDPNMVEETVRLLTDPEHSLKQLNVNAGPCRVVFVDGEGNELEVATVELVDAEEDP